MSRRRKRTRTRSSGGACLPQACPTPLQRSRETSRAKSQRLYRPGCEARQRKRRLGVLNGFWGGEGQSPWRLCRSDLRKGFAFPRAAGAPFSFSCLDIGCRKGRGGVRKSLENRNSLTRRRKVAKQTKEFLLSDLSALAPLRDGFSFFHSFDGRG